MKRLIMMLAVLAATLCTTAQTARQDFAKDIHYSASNYLAYPGPRQAKLTPAPKGKKPFYISHYGRHGSRYLINPKQYDNPYRVLQKADSLGKLTPLGRDVLRRLKLIREEAAGRYGELTQLGAEQHRQIARRMFERFPEVFEGEARIDAKSTVVIRCILSMENALQQLVALNPKLRIRHDASEHDMWYMNYQDQLLRSQAMDSAVQAKYRAYADRYENNDRLMTQLFNDTAYVRRHVNPIRLNVDLFKIASNIQSTELRHTLTLYDLFNDDEVYCNWKKENAWWYIAYGPSTVSGGNQPYTQRNLLRRIIEEADSCLRLYKPGATLRFGHETMVMPLTCLLNLNGFGYATDDFDSLERHGWINYRVFPMAANLQFVFYRRDVNDKDVLVKVLLNENEATLPLKSNIAPYYRWKDVREFYLAKLDAYELTRAQ